MKTDCVQLRFPKLGQCSEQKFLAWQINVNNIVSKYWKKENQIEVFITQTVPTNIFLFFQSTYVHRIRAQNHVITPLGSPGN